MAIPSSLQPANGAENRQMPEFRPTTTGAVGGGNATRAVELPTPGYGNPFSDANRRDSWEEEDEDQNQDEDPADTLYRPPGGGISMMSRAQAALSAANPGGTRLTSERTAPQTGETWRRGQERSYYSPGYESTPSNMVRQDAVAGGLAMRGGRGSQDVVPTSPNTQRGSEAGISEVSDMGRGSVGDVSPVAERYIGRYRS